MKVLMMKNISVLKSFSEPVLMLLYKSRVLNSEKLNSLMRKKGDKYLDIEKKKMLKIEKKNILLIIFKIK